MITRDEAARHPLLQLHDFSFIFDSLGGSVKLLIPEGQVYRKAEYGFGELYSIPCVQTSFNSGHVLSVSDIENRLASYGDGRFANAALGGNNPLLHRAIKKLVKDQIFSIEGAYSAARPLEGGNIVTPGAHYTRARLFSITSRRVHLIELVGSKGRVAFVPTRIADEETHQEQIVYF